MEYSYRECSDPMPQNGGKYCEGQRVQYQSCNTQPCDNHQGEDQHKSAFQKLITEAGDIQDLSLVFRHTNKMAVAWCLA